MALHAARTDCYGHAGYHSALGLYSQEREQIRYVLICDDCGEEVREVFARGVRARPAPRAPGFEHISAVRKRTGGYGALETRPCTRRVRRCSERTPPGRP